MLEATKKKKICFIVGTRPEIIKTAPVILEFYGKGMQFFDSFICTTGQHRTMADQAMEIFGLKADYNLAIMDQEQTLNSISSKILAKLPEIFDRLEPDLVFIQGDTTTAAISGLTAFNMKIPVAHIEAGLRTGDIYSPFPEEVNRKMLSTFSSLNFAPTQKARNALVQNGCAAGSVFITGNTVVDAINIIEERIDLKEIFIEKYSSLKPFILITAHRRESFGQGFLSICKALAASASKHKNINFLYPVHMNPNVKNVVRKELSNISNIRLVDPVSYIDLLSLLSQCLFCVTDSGGIQEEAPSFGKYTVVLRDNTERTESIEAGFSELTGTDINLIVDAIDRQIDSCNYINVKSNPFGQGYASKIILDVTRSYFFDVKPGK